MATLVTGLPVTARIIKKKGNLKITLDQALLARLIDDLEVLMWSMQKRKGAKPKSVYKQLTEEKKEKDELLSFSSPEDYERWVARKKEMRQCQRSQQRTSK